MHRVVSRRLSGVAAIVLVLATAIPTSAQDTYPSKPIRILVTLSAGSQVDFLARVLGGKLTEALGQQVIVENRPGAGGTIATAAVAAAAPDGYTLLMAAPGHAINQTLYARLPYRTLEDFAGVALVARVPSVLIVPTTLGVTSLAELSAMARAKPGQLNYGSPGVGSGGHLAGEQYKLSAKLDIVHVPYKGTPEALTATIGGQIQMFFAPLGAALPAIKDGRVRAIAVTTAERSATLPNTPTMIEAGLSGYEIDFWYGLLAPRKTPQAVVDRLSAEVGKALASPDMHEQLLSQGATASYLPAKRFDAFVASEVEKYAVLVKASGAKAE
jgi:tripartite-type tricarboxylate transporter receptor subunit TctC